MLHSYLSGRGAAPPEWFVSQVCEEFGCMPSEALRESYEDVTTIMSLRSYARAYAVVMADGVTREDAHKRGIPDELIDQVMDNEAVCREVSSG